MVCVIGLGISLSYGMFYASKKDTVITTENKENGSDTISDNNRKEADNRTKVEDEKVTEADISKSNIASTVESNTADNKESSNVTEDKSGDTDNNTASTTKNNSTVATTTTANSKTCSISISCTSILSHMDNLTSGKEAYVPADGVILGTTKMTIEDGDTVFDILTRVCGNKGIQIEYNYTPAYGSYYIEGINQLYEFDCGDGSGWTYYVNGSEPGVGCSLCIVEDGDKITFDFLCR